MKPNKCSQFIYIALEGFLRTTTTIMYPLASTEQTFTTNPIKIYIFSSLIYLQRCNVIRIKAIVHIAQHQRSLPDASFAQQHNLEVVRRLCCLRWCSTGNSSLHFVRRRTLVSCVCFVQLRLNCKDSLGQRKELKKNGSESAIQPATT